jgi:transcriptional regulator
MHPNPVFHDRGTDEALAFAAARGFGTLAISGADGPLLSHVPFLLGDGVADLHLTRSNPIARRLAETAEPAVLAVQGPDGYISPDWYGADDQVPTWNYVAVHLRGRLALRPAAELRALLDRQSAAFESRLAPKPAWTPEKMTPEVLERLLRMIVPVQLQIESIDATWKLSQNKPEAMRLAAATGVAGNGPGQDLAALSQLMRDG